MRRTMFVVCGTALLMGLLTSPVSASSAPGSCSPPYGEPATFADIMATPEVQAGLADGIYDVAHVQLRWDQVNKNGDEFVCVKSVGNDNQFMSVYAGKYVDNNAAPK
ncbi:hypothetical protein [Longivirga aurantiaca]|uniref:Uncharacterized protein n=1 Tax=Longivirga aurantiaca TaxID=1837743 RepID=A0ABW1SZ76_9ACTN